MKPAHTPQTVISPADWQAIPWGENYQQALEQALMPWWSRVFGFHLLKVGALSSRIASHECTISHQVNVSPVPGEGIHVLADAYQLPFAEKSVDACLLAHTLSYSSDPHRILREVDRVLINDGWLLLSGFNPVSLLGMGKLMPGIRQHQPYCARMFTQMRILDWLSLLNYEVMYHSTFQAVPWREPKRTSDDTAVSTSPFGCLTVIVARKRTIPLTITPMRQKFNKLPVRRTVGATKSYRKRCKSS